MGPSTARTSAIWLSAIVLIGCDDQGPSGDVVGVTGVWQVLLDESSGQPYAKDSHCVVFWPNGSLAYETRSFDPRGRPSDSLARLHRYSGSFRLFADSIELWITRWVTYSWFQYLDYPLLIRDSVVSLNDRTGLVVFGDSLEIDGQPGPFELRSRSPLQRHLCGPLP